VISAVILVQIGEGGIFKLEEVDTFLGKFSFLPENEKFSDLGRGIFLRFLFPHNYDADSDNF
jgi:hypothetical protein